MAKFYSESEHLTIEEKIECLDGVISRLCDRFDGFEESLLEIEYVLKELNSKVTNNQDALLSPVSKNMDEFNLNHSDTSKGNETSKVNVSFPSISIVYCGQPEGPGFDNASMTDEKGIRSLYEVKKIDDSHAYFYPLEERLSRFRNNANSLLLPVCSILGDITDCSTFNIRDEDFGLLALEEGNYWKVEKKCIINCVNFNNES